MPPSSFYVLVLLTIALAWVTITWIRSHYGASAKAGNARDAEVETLREQVDAQQQVMGRLEERVRVLERIVTDNAAKLGDEIDRLRA